MRYQMRYVDKNIYCFETD
ncbi:hypothetical protein [Enterococcus faecium]